jgi:isopenicillin N synthase-like dioxygenase
LQAGYATFRELIEAGGATWGAPETAVGANSADAKRYMEFGSRASGNVPAALRELRLTLIEVIDEHRKELEAVMLTGIARPLEDLVDRHDGPVLRFTWYPGGCAGEVNQAHTDIDLFTLLPAATRPGLEILSANGWQPVGTGWSEILVLRGEILHHLGGRPATEHRVVTDGHERISTSLFVNADPSLPTRARGRVGDLFDARLAAVRGQREENA